jgi:hypothetical protein
LTGDIQKAYGLNKAISICFSLKKMTILDVIFPKKNPFCTSRSPIFWSQSGELPPQYKTKKKKKKEERKITMGKMEEHVYRMNN